MVSVLSRGPFTAWLKSTLTTNNILVDIGAAPPTGGWSGDPQSPSSTYTRYLTILPRTASKSDGPFTDVQSTWMLPYTFTSFGITPQQVEGQADIARKVVSEMAKKTVLLGTLQWRIMQTSCDSIGSMDMNKNIDPYEYSQTDVFIFNLTQ